jgi:hypothetical protein
MFLDFLIERTSRDPKSLRRLLDATTLLLKHTLYVLLLELYQRQAGVKEGCANLCVSIELEIVESDGLLAAQQNRAFDNIPKFSDVARPGIGFQGLNAALIKFQLAAA